MYTILFNCGSLSKIFCSSSQQIPWKLDIIVLDNNTLDAFNYRTSKISFRKTLQEITMSTNTDLSLSSYDEGQGSKFVRKAKETPFVPIGKWLTF